MHYWCYYYVRKVYRAHGRCTLGTNWLSGFNNISLSSTVSQLELTYFALGSINVLLGYSLAAG